MKKRYIVEVEEVVNSWFWVSADDAEDATANFEYDREPDGKEFHSWEITNVYEDKTDADS